MMTLMTSLFLFCVNCWDSNCVNIGFSCSSWTSWLIPALIATIVGIVCRYYMSDRKSSWVLPFQIHPILIIRRPSNVSNLQNTGHTQPGVCASSATREEWEEFERVHLCFYMQVHHIDSLVNPYSIVSLSLSVIPTMPVLFSHALYFVLCVFPAHSVTSHISWDATNTATMKWSV